MRFAALVVLLSACGSAAAQEITPAHGPVEARRPLFGWLLPSDTGRYIGYHVGGGAGQPRKAEPRQDDEGTWGWDYQGWLPRRVILGWWHGRRYQGGTGAYATDGPKRFDR
ncbi:MAG: hypothetical protein HY289_00540 [Planctomycetes bacterium]|nr:hypothetical protein [Planctomycetota bacterium]